MPHTQLEMSRLRSARPVSMVPVSSSEAMDIKGTKRNAANVTGASAVNEK